MTTGMQVVKRDGVKEEVSFDKVLNRIKKLSGNLGVNATEVAQKVCSRIYDGVHTRELDELAAHICSSLIVEHPDYEQLASRIVVSNHHKNTSPSFSETITQLYKHCDESGAHHPLVSKDVYDVVTQHKTKLNSYIDYQRDYDINFFGFRTLEKSYLFRVDDKVVERPQHMFMRVAIGIHRWDIKDVLETYDLMSTKHFIHATPTLFNAGTPRPQLSSCFLGGIDDSIDGIYNALHDCASISKYAGGIGMHISNIRGKDSAIRGTNGKSTGIVPMLRVFNNTARYVNQSGRRNGSIAMYIEPWHPDVMSFLQMKKNHGAEEERARDLFYAMWIPDLFMKRVQENGVWSLMCPDTHQDLVDLYGDEFETAYCRYEQEGSYVRQVNAQDIWYKILESQIETGTPYMLFKDSVNHKSNQKNIGTIKSSNLCVSGDTKILTSAGYYPIEDLCGMSVQVWNGEEWSSTVVTQTSPCQKLLRVALSNGVTVRCTPYHKFVLTGVDADAPEDETFVEARNLEVGATLAPFDIPTIRDFGQGPGAKTNYAVERWAYTYGFIAGTSVLNTTVAEHGGTTLTLHNNKFHMVSNMLECVSHYPCKQHRDFTTVHVRANLNTCKRYVPLNEWWDVRVSWLAGLLDSAGDITHDSCGRWQLHVHAKAMLSQDTFLMLQTLGVNSSVQHVAPDMGFVRISIDVGDIITLCKNGLSSALLPDDLSSCYYTDYKAPIKVVAVVDANEFEPTYCFHETKRNRGMFGGVVLGNCTEITEYSDDQEIAVCNLASVCLPTFVRDGEFDHGSLHKTVKTMTKNLNKVIDINFYPVDKAKLSNMRHRPIGIGVQGLADTFVKMGFAYESDDAKRLNKEIFETIYHAAVEQSMALSKRRGILIRAVEAGEELSPGDAEFAHINEHEAPYVSRMPPDWKGAYATFDGSPASQGLLQFDMWGVAEHSGRYDWDRLKDEVVQHGLRNSLMVAPMPTASTSQIMGFNEAFEPFTSNMYKRKTIAGEFIVINRHLIHDLIRNNLWNRDMKEAIILHDGSIAKISNIPDDLKELYKTVWEIKQKNVIDMAADRGAYICQSQSMNLFVDDPNYKKLTTMHFYAWKKGLKTGMYYLRTKPKSSAQKFTIDPTNLVRNDAQEECIACSA